MTSKINIFKLGLVGGLMIGTKYLYDYLNDEAAEPLIHKIHKHDKKRYFESFWKKIYSSRMHYYCKDLIKKSIRHNFYNWKGYIEYSAFDDYTYQTGWYPNVTIINQVLEEENFKDKFTEIKIINENYRFYDHIFLLPDFESKVLNIKFGERQ